ncbi:MAG: hypothetical protein ACXVA9_06270 [Bdellovibrionales bacterium]
MNRLLATTAIFCFTSIALAGTRADLDRQQIKAIADAIITQHKVASDESIHAIINKAQIFKDEKAEVNHFTIQYQDAAGKCTQEGVEVLMKAGTAVPEVTFFRYPRQECQ